MTPYGFGGFAAREPSDRFPAEWEAFAQDSGWVCAYIALNPVLFDATGFPAEDVYVHTSLYVMDLEGSDDDVFRRLSQNRRRQLRDWPDVAPTLEHDRAALAEFLVAHYQEFFDRRGAGEATDFDAGTVRAIAELDEVFMVGAAPEGALEAVAVFGYTPVCGDYLFNVSVPGGERHAAHLIWAGVHWLRSQAVPRLNLGGGIRAGDQVAEFKRRFGGTELPLTTLRQVYREDLYERLCREAGVPAADRSGYFPAYRA